MHRIRQNVDTQTHIAYTYTQTYRIRYKRCYLEACGLCAMSATKMEYVPSGVCVSIPSVLHILYFYEVRMGSHHTPIEVFVLKYYLRAYTLHMYDRWCYNETEWWFTMTRAVITSRQLQPLHTHETDSAEICGKFAMCVYVGLCRALGCSISFANLLA